MLSYTIQWCLPYLFFSSVGDLPPVSAARAAQRRDLGGHGPTFGPSWSPWCSVGGSEKEGRARGRGVGVGSFAANSHHLNEVGRALLSIKKHRVRDLVARVNPLLSHPVHQQPPCAGSTASRKVFQYIAIKRRLETSRVVIPSSITGNRENFETIGKLMKQRPS